MYSKQFVVSNKALNPIADFTVRWTVHIEPNVPQPAYVSIHPGILRRVDAYFTDDKKSFTVTVPCHAVCTKEAAIFASRIIDYIKPGTIQELVKGMLDKLEATYVLAMVYGSVYFLDMPGTNNYTNPVLFTYKPMREKLKELSVYNYGENSVHVPFWDICANEVSRLHEGSVLSFAKHENIWGLTALTSKLNRIAEEYELDGMVAITQKLLDINLNYVK